MDLELSSVGWSATDFWVPEIVSCWSAGLGMLDFDNGEADTVLWYCSVLFYVFRLPAFLEGS